jgi:hypothetical protein
VVELGGNSLISTSDYSEKGGKINYSNLIRSDALHNQEWRK